MQQPVREVADPADVGGSATRRRPRGRAVLRRFGLLVATLSVGAAAAVSAALGAPAPARWMVIVFAGGIAVGLAVRIAADLIRGQVGVDVLAVTAIAATLAVGEYAAALVIVLMLAGGEALEQYAGGRAQRELTALLAAAPRVAHLVTGDEIRDIAADRVQVGDVLLVRPAEVVPVDGVLTSAAGTFDESSVTGESLPAERVSGDPVLSGSVNGAAAVMVRASTTAAKSQYMQIVSLVRSATEGKSRMVRLADRYAVPFTVLAYAIAAVAWMISGDPVRFAAVLVVATPCPLLIAAPVALLGGMSRAAQRGIIVKSGTALEVSARARAVAFDKTGTLTLGRPSLLAIRHADWISADEVLALAAAAEQHSSHVLAHSIIQAAVDRGLVLLPVTDGSEWATHGVTAVVGGRAVHVGKPSFVADRTGPAPEVDLGGGEVAVHVGVDGRYAGALLLADPPRPEAADAVASLRAMGIGTVLMLTGDAEPTARAIARQLGIADVRAECLPADKVSAVRDQRARPVIMVGDGVNDAPVLAAADVGVAMGARGATAAAESALVVLLKDRVGLVVDLVAIGRRTVRVALESIWLGIALSVALMGVAAFGGLPPLLGAISQEAVDLAAIGNALRTLSPGHAQARRS